MVSADTHWNTPTTTGNQMAHQNSVVAADNAGNIADTADDIDAMVSSYIGNAAIAFATRSATKAGDKSFHGTIQVIVGKKPEMFKVALSQDFISCIEPTLAPD